MKATKAFFALIVTAALMAVSCEKEIVTVEPVLGSIVFSQAKNSNIIITSCKAGDTIKATVKYLKDGEYFAFRKSSSSFPGLSNIADTIYTTFMGYAGAEPYVTFKVKDVGGKFKIEFLGQVDRQAGTEINGNQLRTSGSITIIQPAKDQEDEEE